MEFGTQQSQGLTRVRAWLADPYAPQVFRLFGYAGTGKTTLAKEIPAMVRGRVLFAAYTGKAALVLRTKGCLSASTIHGLIYKADDSLPPACEICKGLGETAGKECTACGGSGNGKHDGKPIFRLNPESPVRGAGLVIIDECSMVGDDLAKDLLSFDVRILVLGDPAQLRPVTKGKGTSTGGYFTNADPDFMLTDIHRQALENPIVKMSMDIREGRGVQLGTYGESRVILRKDIQPGEIMGADQVLCGTNNTRRGLNHRFRDKLGYTEDFPMVGDRLVCLKNDRERQLYNGSLWETIESSMDRRYVKMKVRSLDQGGATAPAEVMVPVEFFHGTEDSLEYRIKRSFDQFDFGYALTVHKSQGSAWPHVMVFDESHVFREDAQRHLYTAVTRASEKVTIIV